MMKATKPTTNGRARRATTPKTTKATVPTDSANGSPNGKAKVSLETSIIVPTVGGEAESLAQPGAKSVVLPNAALPGICAELQQLQRQRAVVLKSRIMQHNRLVAVVAGTMGYSTNLAENERRQKFKEAATLITKVRAGKVDHILKDVILTTLIGIDAFNQLKSGLEKSMIKLAKQLPVAAWVQEPEQKGFGLLSLAIVVGETGNLDNYANPSRLMRRLGCSPWEFEGKTFMGATWRSGKEGKLPASEWERFGYSPRRRSIAYLIGANFVRQSGTKKRKGGHGDSDGNFEEENGGADLPLLEDLDLDLEEGNGDAVRDIESELAGPSSLESPAVGQNDNPPDLVEKGVLPVTGGPYRAKYEWAKADAQARHPDWPKMRCHRHGMLLATKRLLKNLWTVWKHCRLGKR